MSTTQFYTQKKQKQKKLSVEHTKILHVYILGELCQDT